MEPRARPSNAPPGPAAGDADLVQRFRSGDRAAFDALVERHQVAIRRLVLRYVKSPEDAKDVSQKTFIRALERLDTFRGEASFRTWLYRIAVNLALNHVRGVGLGELVPLEDVVAFTSSLETAKLVASEVWRKVSARLDELPPRQRLVLELRVFHDLSFEEVAAVVDSTEAAAKMNFHHAVKRLREVLPLPGT
jgi:RNA polymerase sigma-70 factor, ECF subfamily